MNLQIGVAFWQLAAVLLLLALCSPATILRLLLAFYPDDDDRRRELPAEMAALALWKRPIFALEQVETIAREALRCRSASGRRSAGHGPRQRVGAVGPVDERETEENQKQALQIDQVHKGISLTNLLYIWEDKGRPMRSYDELLAVLYMEAPSSG